LIKSDKNIYAIKFAFDDEEDMLAANNALIDIKERAEH